jgi:YHS domain-containing protein
MKRILLAATALTLSMGVAVAAPGAKAPEKPAAQTTPVCPVMNHEIGVIEPDTPNSVYNGKTYYFCCAGCKPTFDKDPAKYVKDDTQKKPAKNKKG